MQSKPCSDLCLVLLLQANAIYLELVNLGFKVEHCEESCAKWSAAHSRLLSALSLSFPPKVWYDNRADDLTKDGMLEGIERAAAFVLFLSVGVLTRPYCQLEVRHALALKKPMVLLHGTQRGAATDAAIMRHRPVGS